MPRRVKCFSEPRSISDAADGAQPGLSLINLNHLAVVSSHNRNLREI